MRITKSKYAINSYTKQFNTGKVKKNGLRTLSNLIKNNSIKIFVPPSKRLSKLKNLFDDKTLKRLGIVKCISCSINGINNNNACPECGKTKNPSKRFLNDERFKGVLLDAKI